MSDETSSLTRRDLIKAGGAARPSFNAGAAADGWKRCTDWFAKYLKA